MIEVQDIILSLRSRLRDKDIIKEYSDNELLDFINMAYIAIASKLKLFAKEIEFDLATQKPLLPKDCISIITAYHNNTKCDILPFSYFLKNKSSSPALTLNNNEIILYPKNDTGILKIVYNYIKRIARVEDSLDLGAFLLEGVVFYCMFLALQKEARTDSLQKSQYYQNLYQLEIEKAQALQTEMLNSQDITSDYQRI